MKLHDRKSRDLHEVAKIAGVLERCMRDSSTVDNAPISTVHTVSASARCLRINTLHTNHK